MPVAAVWARDQHRSVVVPLLRHLVLGPEVAGDAGEGELVVRDLGDVALGLFLLLFGLLLVGGKGLGFSRGGGGGGLLTPWTRDGVF